MESTSSIERRPDRAPQFLRGAVGLDESHRRAMHLFFRLLAGVYAIAFVSLAVQVRGLLGETGILPAAGYLNQMFEMLGSRAWRLIPTLFWFEISDGLLVAACWLGAASSLAIAAGILQGPLLLLNWILYLSLVSVGQVFLNYQWDVLLLEAGFLAIWAAPWKTGLRVSPSLEPSLAWVWLLRWLLFRLMFASGWVKLSTDEVWRTLSALEYHFWTQPLPPWTAWWIHQAPPWIGKLGVAATLLSECLAPWLMFTGRRGRQVAALVLAGFQTALMATGNFGFFNLLAIALCVPLWSDPPPKIPEGEAGDGLLDAEAGGRTPLPDPYHHSLAKGIRWGIVAAVFLFSLTAMLRIEAPQLRLPYPADALERTLGPFHIVNRYGLFADMTESRPEIVIEFKSPEGTWKPVPFRWKPGPTDARPKFAPFHMPRLDWQMWFEGLNFLNQHSIYELNAIPAPDRHYYPNLWFINFMDKLHRDESAAIDLLGWGRSRPPVQDVRALIYQYRFTSQEERLETGQWWKREQVARYY